MSDLTTFSFEYIISVSVSLFITYLVNKSAPNINPFLTYFVVPLTIAFITLKIINILFPKVNYVGSKTYRYVKGNLMRNIYNMNYLQVFPPFFAVLIIIFIILMFNFV